MYDLIIIGSGPAGLSAAVYAKRAGLNMLVIEKNPVSGGQIIDTYEVDNYLGLKGISGMELGQKFAAHAKDAGINELVSPVTAIEPMDGGFKVITVKETIETKTVIVATGAVHAHLGAKGEAEFGGMGVT